MNLSYYTFILMLLAGVGNLFAVHKAWVMKMKFVFFLLLINSTLLITASVITLLILVQGGR